MVKIQKLLKKITPPILLDIAKYITNMSTENSMWSGNFPDWETAMLNCKGYNKENILEKCKIALLKVKNGEATYERDSVIFDKIEYSWPVLSGLQKAALENNGELFVLDFGGSLGSSYYQNKDYLKGLKKLSWCIVEQAHFVDCGKQYFEDDNLKFFKTIAECIDHQKPNVILLSSVLQYLEKPKNRIKDLISINANYIIIDRTSIIEESKDFLTVQSVPKIIYQASYPCWIFNEDNLLNDFQNYNSIIKFDPGISEPIIVNGKTVTWSGYLLKKNNEKTP